MLPKQNKISRREFPPRSGCVRVWNGTILRIQCYLEKNNQIYPRFSIIFPKRVVKTAVSRNYFKRAIFSVIREHLSEISKLPYGFYVVIPKGNIKDMVYHSIDSDIVNFIKDNKKT